MNILVVNDDGKNALGLKLLREGVSLTLRDAKVVCMTTAEPGIGMSMGVSEWRDARDLPMKQLDTDYYEVDCKPCDLLYLACGHPELFLNTGGFDAVFAGINHGHNVGFDVFHSGTVGLAMFAAKVFGVYAVSFSQQMEHTEPSGTVEEAAMFQHTPLQLARFLREERPDLGTCYNVNFPSQQPKGWARVQVAHASRWRKMGMGQGVPGEKTDMSELDKGLVTVSELDLRVSPRMPH